MVEPFPGEGGAGGGGGEAEGGGEQDGCGPDSAEHDDDLLLNDGAGVFGMEKGAAGERRISGSEWLSITPALAGPAVAASVRAVVQICGT